MTDATPTDTPPGPNWRIVADDEEVLAGDMYQVGNADYQEWMVRFQAGRNTNRTYYRRIDVPSTKDDTVSKKSPKVLTEMEQRAAVLAVAMAGQENAWDADHNDSQSLLSPQDFAQSMLTRALQYLQDGITLWAIQKGWMTEEPRNPAEQLMLIVTELAEACEAFRVGNPPCERPGMEHFSHAAEELADVVIRCFQMAGEHSIPLGEVIQAKMKFNHTRPIKHGKKF